MDIKWNGQEVTSPVKQFFVVLWGSVLTGLGVMVIIAFIGVMMLTWWLWIPLDWLLKLVGCRGFIIHNPDGTITLSFTPDAFRHA